MCIRFVCGGRELAGCVGWFSPRDIFLFIACCFTFLSLPKVCCWKWGREIFPVTWCLTPAASDWFLWDSEEHTPAAEDPKPVLVYDSLQNLPPLGFRCFAHVKQSCFSENSTVETLLWSGSPTALVVR